jgi:hypothetical protein
MHCHVSVRNLVDAGWVQEVAGLTASSDVDASGAPVTRLDGTVEDQAALVGLINALYSYGLVIVELECHPAGAAANAV